MVNNLLILGGGNAGVMAALYLKSSLPSLDITIIKSDKIGTIGVGEGSTEHWQMWAEVVGIENREILQEAGATLKAGIKFTNWHGDGTSYFHSLPEHFCPLDLYNGIPYTLMRLVTEREPGTLHWDLAVSGLHPEPYHNGFSQFHFDSVRLNRLLLKKCVERKIKVIDADITDVELDQDGYVKSIVDSQNKRYTADFFIDSSGFKRIISSKLGSKWVDWSEYLPMNSAIAFPTPGEENIPPYTLATALTSGWSWKSPIQERYGNGYVFCDSFISEDKAIEEIQKYYPEAIEIGRKVNFTSGKADKFWIKNCVSLGLSSGFVEPLEASSISTTVQQSRALANSLTTWSRGDNYTVNKYNKLFDEVMTNNLDFIQLHYFTERNDTEFWKYCKNSLKMTDFNRENLEIFKKNFINQMQLPTDNYNIYDLLNWVQIMHGLRMFDIKSIRERYDAMFGHWTPVSLYQLSTVPDLEHDNFITTREVINKAKQQPIEIHYKL